MDLCELWRRLCDICDFTDMFVASFRIKNLKNLHYLRDSRLKTECSFEMIFNQFKFLRWLSQNHVIG